MKELNDIIIKAASTPDRLTPDDFTELRRIDHDYPASAIAAALLLKYDDAHLSEQDRHKFRSKVALLCGDRHAVITMIDPSGYDFAHFYPSDNTQTTPSTENAIDTFLETYGHQSAEEDALLERMIFNPVPDYAETLARQEQQTASSSSSTNPHDKLIDAFLAANPVDEHTNPLTPPAFQDTPAQPTTPVTQKNKPAASVQPDDSTLLSESLAKIFIKQGRYQRAYEIISNLSLNYPEKSVYFAVQLRFLRKLIINQRHTQS